MQASAQCGIKMHKGLPGNGHGPSCIDVAIMVSGTGHQYKVLQLGLFSLQESTKWLDTSQHLQPAPVLLLKTWLKINALLRFGTCAAGEGDENSCVT